MESFADIVLCFLLIPADTNTMTIHFVAGYFDTSNGAEEANIMFPLDRLRELVARGEVRTLADQHLSMGLTTELRKLKETVSWAIAETLMKMRPDVVVLTGG